MADIYVDPIDGVDSAAGGSAAPLKTLGLAIARADASDRILVVGGNNRYHRGVIVSAAASRIQPATAGDYIHVLPAINVSAGAARNPMMRGGDAEAWVDASTPYTWLTDVGALAAVTKTVVGASTVTRSDDAFAGTHAFLLTRPATDVVQLSFRVWRLPGEAISVSFRYKASQGTPTMRVQLYSEATKYWNNATQAWSDTLVNNQYSTSGTYQQATITIPADTDPAGFAAGQFLILTFTTGSIGPIAFLVDDVTVTGEFSNYAWAADQGDTVVLSTLVFDDGETTPRHMLKASLVEFAAEGVDALRNVAMAASLAACRSTPGSCYYDPATTSLYYTLETGESIDALRLEFVKSKFAVTLEHAMRIAGVCVHGTNRGFSNTAGATLIDCHAYDTNVGTDRGEAFFASTAAAAAINCSLVRCDGFVSSAVNYTLQHCLAVLSYDDGYQAIAAGGISATGCLSLFNGQEETSGNDGFGSEEAGSYMNLHGCLVYGSWQNGIRLGADYGNSVIRNNVAISNNRSDSGTNGDVTDRGSAGTLDWDYNAYATTGDPAPAAGANDIAITAADVNTDELDSVAEMTNAEIRAWHKERGKTLVPTGSQLVGAGAPKWWTGPRPVSCSGEPIPDTQIDIGPQSTHGSLHPSNL